jgi:hypothetical protein
MPQKMTAVDDWDRFTGACGSVCITLLVQVLHSSSVSPS